MTTVTLEIAQANLPELLADLAPGDEIVITAGGTPLASLRKSGTCSQPREAGTAKHRKFWMSPDFNAPLDDYAESVP